MKKEDIETIFHFLSKAIIIVPLMVIVLALIIKIGHVRDSLFLPQKILVAQPTVSPLRDELKKMPVVQPASQEATFDLNGPWVCAYSFSGGSLSASIKNKNAIAHFVSSGKTDNFLLNGDCGYMWESGLYSGQKICGISSYLSIFDALSRFKMVDVGTLFQYLPQLGIKNGMGLQEADLKNFSASCKKQEIGETSFEIPKNVLFKNITK